MVRMIPFIASLNEVARSLLRLVCVCLCVCGTMLKCCALQTLGHRCSVSIESDDAHWMKVCKFKFSIVPVCKTLWVKNKPMKDWMNEYRRKVLNGVSVGLWAKISSVRMWRSQCQRASATTRVRTLISSCVCARKELLHKRLCADMFSLLHTHSHFRTTFGHTWAIAL